VDRARGRTKEMEEGADIPFHRHAQSSQLPSHTFTHAHTHSWICSTIHIYACISIKYMYRVSHRAVFQLILFNVLEDDIYLFFTQSSTLITSAIKLNIVSAMLQIKFSVETTIEDSRNYEISFAKFQSRVRNAIAANAPNIVTAGHFPQLDSRFPDRVGTDRQDTLYTRTRGGYSRTRTSIFRI